MIKRIALVLLFLAGSVFAETTDNLITSPLSPTVNATAPAGYSGGSTAGYNSSTNTYYFGYTQQVLATTIAINNALQGSGVQVGGVQYGMQYLNGGDSYGTLSLGVNVTSAAGATLHSYSHSFNTQNAAWQTFDQTQTFTNPYTLANLGNVSMSITGQDSRFWAGYYGPQVRNPYLRLTYTPETPVVTTPTFYDDTYAPVPLQFGFPFYGRTFTNSWMHSNGVVSFLDPAVPIPDVGNNPGAWAYCCGDRPTTTKPQFQYIIAPLWTDLYATSDSSFRTEGTSTYQKYYWNNLGEISNTSNKNTFSLELRPSGYLGVNYTQINMNQTAWIGTVGNPAAGEINEVFYGQPGIGNIAGITNWYMNSTPVGDLCLINPLSSTSCAGYADAMCAANPLYSTTCSGYAAAYYSQQCTANALYDPGCPGYASAYLDYQCSLNALYSTSCKDYQQAYHNQQCSLNPLYATDCTGYQTAATQCSANPLLYTYCPSYETAVSDCTTNGLTHSYCPSYTLEVQLCTTNPLSNTLCSGYATASQVCSNNQLTYTYCPSYTTTLASCATNPQSNTLCPGYSTASTSNSTTTASTSITQAAPSIGSDGTVTTTVSSTGSSTVDKAITSTTTTTNTAAAPAAPVQLVQAAPAAAAPASPQAAQGGEQKKETKQDDMAKQETKKEESTQTASSPQNKTDSGSASGGGKSETKSTRQQIAEKRAEARQVAARQAGKEATEKMDKANSLEAQIAVQNVVVAAMGFVPGFQTYSVIMPDGVGYKPHSVYNNQKTVDNARMMRGLSGASDRLHEEMVASQYNR